MFRKFLLIVIIIFVICTKSLTYLVLDPDDCLFDAQGMCFWKEESPRTSGFIWRRISGRTPSGSTGPDNDHTTEKTTKDGNTISIIHIILRFLTS